MNQVPVTTPRLAAIVWIRSAAHDATNMIQSNWKYKCDKTKMGRLEHRCIITYFSMENGLIAFNNKFKKCKTIIDEKQLKYTTTIPNEGICGGMIWTQKNHCPAQNMDLFSKNTNITSNWLWLLKKPWESGKVTLINAIYAYKF